MGLPPVNLVTVSRMMAGMMWTKKAEKRKRETLETNLRCGYHTADFNGYLCKYELMRSCTLIQRNGLRVLVVQWYTSTFFDAVEPKIIFKNIF